MESTILFIFVIIDVYPRLSIYKRALKWQEQSHTEEQQVTVLLKKQNYANYQAFIISGKYDIFYMLSFLFDVVAPSLVVTFL